MANDTNQVPIAPTPEQVSKFVQDSDDFGFELRVGAALQKAEHLLSIEHGGTYLDPFMQKPRQFDFRVQLRKDRRNIWLAVECKNIDPSFPVVVCGRQRRQKEAVHDVVETHPSRSAQTRMARPGSFYRTDVFVGKSIVKMRPTKPRDGSSESDVHDKWAQALSSSHDLFTSAQSHADAFRERTYGVVLPVLVVPDGSLWQAAYGSDGTLVAPPAPKNDCEFYVAHRIISGPGLMTVSHIHFCSLTGLSSLLLGLHSFGDYWEQLFPTEVTGIE